MTSRILPLLLIVVGCDRPVAPQSAATQPATSPAITRASTAAPGIATALGLGATATPEEMDALERRAKEAGKFKGQGCGVTALPDGTICGSYNSTYAVPVLGYEEPQYLSFGHIQDGAHPIVWVQGPEFAYHLQDGIFVLRTDSTSR